jgi:CzcA family heavy metal efflux pump
MMRSIVGWSLRLPRVAIGIAVALLVLGVVNLRNMPVDVLPEFTPPFVEVQAEAPGLSASEVEALLTVPLEEALTGTAQLETMRSRSVPGLSSILLIFEPGTDVMRARQFVQERLTTQTLLPNVSQPPVMLQPMSATSRALFIGISSNDLSLIEQSVLARWKIRPTLMGVPGVANVAIWGQRAQQLQVQVDPERMRARGVSLDQVIEASGDALWVSQLSFLNASYPGSGGWIDTPQQRLAVRHVLPISTPDELGQVVVTVQDGRPVLLRDVASVVEDHPPLIGDAVVNDGPGLLLVIEKFPWGNTLELTRGVEAALAELQPGLPGVEFDTTIFRPATFIELAIGNLSWALLLGSLLVVVVLFFFLWEWRVALISMVAIPLSLLAGGLVLYWRGATINVMVLAGFVIAVGVVVDDAIIDVENIARRLRQHRRAGSTQSTASIILEASLEVRSSITYATLIIVLAMVPVFFLEGLTGAFFQPLAIAYALAVLASMLVALTVTPALALILLRNAPIERRESPLVGWLQRAYAAVLGRILRTARRALVLVTVVAVALGALVLVGGAVGPQLGQSLLPSFRETDLMIRWEAPPGTSRPEMVRITTAASRELRAIPGVRSVSALVGRAALGDQIVGINSGEIWVSLDPAAPANAALYDATLAAVQDTVDGYPGLRRDVQTYLQDRTEEILTGTSDAIVVRIYGPDLTVLRALAEDVRQRISRIEGVVDLDTEAQVDEPHVQVEADLASVERYGLKPGDVRRAAAALVGGIQVGSLFEKQKVFDVVVWSTPDTRTSLTSLRGLLIDTPTGGKVRLDNVASVRVVSTPTEIRHEANSSRIDVALNVSGRDPGSVARDVETALQQVDFPLEYHPELIGEYAEGRGAEQRLLAFALAAAIGIFLLLQAGLGSWRLAALASLMLPTAVLGGSLAALASGNINTLGALVGFFTVLAIAARNGILLLNHLQVLERLGDEPFGRGLVLRGARERLLPILMTAFATGVAVLPFLILGDLPGFEIARPMAIVILGGVVISTLLNLFVVPLVYLGAGPSPEQDEAALLVEQPRLSPTL